MRKGIVHFIHCYVPSNKANAWLLRWRYSINIIEWNDLLIMNNCTSFKSSFGDKAVCECSSCTASQVPFKYKILWFYVPEILHSFSVLTFFINKNCFNFPQIYLKSYFSFPILFSKEMRKKSQIEDINNEGESVINTWIDRENVIIYVCIYAYTYTPLLYNRILEIENHSVVYDSLRLHGL